MSIGSFERYPLLLGPSPVHPLGRVSAHLGGAQPNHTRQVAAVAARTGLRCVLIQESWVDLPPPAADRAVVIGIDASATPTETRDQITRIARRTARLIGVEGKSMAGLIDLFG